MTIHCILLSGHRYILKIIGQDRKDAEWLEASAPEDQHITEFAGFSLCLIHPRLGAG